MPMPVSALRLYVLPGRFAVCRLDPRASIPFTSLHGPLYSVTRTADELSIVCRESDIPEAATVERGWACLKVHGPLDFGMTGVMASLTAPLVDAGVSVFTISTFDTDYLLVKAGDLEQAVEALEKAGHHVVRSM